MVLMWSSHTCVRLLKKISSRDPSSPTVDWSHIQGLFERSKSDVLVLLDCCAAASSAPRRRGAVMETIAACGFEGRAPPPGEHSFTTSLIEVLKAWINVPFSISMLHGRVLDILMQRRQERGWNGQKLEWRSTPVYINNYTHPRTIGIELCKRGLIDTESFPLNRSLSSIEDPLKPTGTPIPDSWVDLMTISCNGLDERLGEFGSRRDRSVGPLSSPNLTDSGPDDVTPKLKLPHMLVSIALNEDQLLPNHEAVRRWICAFPGLAKHVKVEGVFASYSTVLILSIPVVIWNKLPDHPACQAIAYVTSQNLIRENFEKDPDYCPGFVKSPSPTVSSSVTDASLYSSSDASKSCECGEALIGFREFDSAPNATVRYPAEVLPPGKQQSYHHDSELHGRHDAANTTSDLTVSHVKSPMDMLSGQCVQAPYRAFPLPLYNMEEPVLNSLRNRYIPASAVLESSNLGTSWHGQQPETIPREPFDRRETPTNSVKIEERVSSSTGAEVSKDEAASPSSDFLLGFHRSRWTSSGFSEPFENNKFLSMSRVKGLHPSKYLAPPVLTHL